MTPVYDGGRLFESLRRGAQAEAQFRIDTGVIIRDIGAQGGRGIRPQMTIVNHVEHATMV